MEKRMSDTIDTRIKDLEEAVFKLDDENYQMRDGIEMIKQFLISSSIGQEQLWSVVFEDILKQPVPIGESFDSMARKL